MQAANSAVKIAKVKVRENTKHITTGVPLFLSFLNTQFIILLTNSKRSADVPIFASTVGYATQNPVRNTPIRAAQPRPTKDPRNDQRRHMRQAKPKRNVPAIEKVPDHIFNFTQM